MNNQPEQMEADSTTEDTYRNGHKRIKLHQGENTGEYLMEQMDADREDGTAFATAQGVPGICAYPRWKPPAPMKRVYTKTFYLELKNQNFDYGQIKITGGTLQNPVVNTCTAPYYNLPWWMLMWYLDTAEYYWLLHNTNSAKIVSSNFQVSVVGQRLPFTTNDDTSSVANSSVDQSLDIFRGVEKRFPFLTIDEGGETVFSPAKTQNIFQKLYGVGKLVPATAGYRNWELRPMFINGHQGDGSDKVLWPPLETPSLGEMKYVTVDLRTYRGPVVQVNYKPTNGLLAHAPSLGKPNMSSVLIQQNPSGTDRTVQVRKTIFTNDDKTGQEINPFADEYQYNYKFEQNNQRRSTVASLGSAPANADYINYHFMTDLEGTAYYDKGPEPVIPKYDSLFLGVRPQMNGSKIQAGITAIEIKTNLTVEYQVYTATNFPGTTFPAGTDIRANMARQKYNLSNDQNRMMVIPYLRSMNYAGGSNIIHYESLNQAV